MKRILLAGIAALPFLLVQPTHSHAVIMECANCATTWDQLVANAKQAQQYALQLQQRVTQLQQYANQVQNTLQLPMSIYQNITNDINQVRSLANAASLLTGNSGSIMSRLQSAQGYANQALYTPQNIGQQFTMWQQTIGQASNSLGRTLGMQQGQEAGYAVQQAQIQAMTPTGQLQAIQQTNQLAALTSTQLNQMQTTITAMAQEQATRGIVAADRQGSEDAAMQRLQHGDAIEVNGYKGY